MTFSNKKIFSGTSKEKCAEIQCSGAARIRDIRSTDPLYNVAATKVAGDFPSVGYKSI